MDLDQRRRVQQSFAEKTRILVSTDAGGEGLNLQFAHVVINYDRFLTVVRRFLP